MSSSNLAVGRSVIAITPSNTVKLGASVRAIYVGVGGNISVTLADNSTAVFVGVPQGSILPVEVVRVNATGTTASSLVGLV